MIMTLKEKWLLDHIVDDDQEVKSQKLFFWIS